MEIDRDDIHHINGIFQLIDSIDLNNKIDAMIKYSAISQLCKVVEWLIPHLEEWERPQNDFHFVARMNSCASCVSSAVFPSERLSKHSPEEWLELARENLRAALADLEEAVERD